jgi:hypothetical protein
MVHSGTFYEQLLLKPIFMNKNLLITTAVSLGASALLYMLRRRMKAGGRSVTAAVTDHTRHLTNVFSKAKHNLTS